MSTSIHHAYFTSKLVLAFLHKREKKPKTFKTGKFGATS